MDDRENGRDGYRVGTTSGDIQQRQVDVTAPQVRVFINYRRDDTYGEAQLLYDRLVSRFGSESLFLDIRSLQPGVKWLEDIRSHSDTFHVFLSLIGRRWISIMRERDQAAIVQPAQDYVRSEIQLALRPNSGIHVIPVLVGDGVSLKPEDLPRSLRPLAQLEVVQIRQTYLEQDIELLANRLEEIAREQRAISPDPVTARVRESHPASIPAGTRGVAPPPHAAHCEEVLRLMVDEGNLVPFLGSRMAPGRAGTVEGPPALPDAEELAEVLARRFRIEQTRPDLAEIAQYVVVTRGTPDLYRTLRQILTTELEPGPVHRFLARLPGTLEELGLEKRYQLIVSTNFDTALERAFDDKGEPYDLAVYMASGPDKGKFVHFPAEGDPQPISKPNSYTKLPIGLEYELERTVIVKIHGAVDRNVSDYGWKENYVITEDHYIDYLSRSPIESLVPVQIIDKLRQSHCLFLGYTVRDWNLRVFLKRIWNRSLGANSWAVEPAPDELEKRLWAQSNVDLYAANPVDYVDLLQERLSEPPRKSDEQ